LRLTVTVTVIAILLSKIDLNTVARLILDTDVLWLVSACLLLGLAFALAGLRWWLVLQRLGLSLPLPRTLALTLVGQFFSSFLPGSTGGDLVRLLYACRHTWDNKGGAAASLMLDRCFGVLALLILGLAAALANPVLHTVVHTKLLAALLAAIVTGVMLAGWWLNSRSLPPWLQRLPFAQTVSQFFVSLGIYFRSPRSQAAAFIVSLVLQAMVLLCALALAQALALDAPASAIVLAVVAAECIISLPISLGGHGLRESAFMVMFGLLDISSSGVTVADAAVAFSLLYFGLHMFWGLAGGLTYLACPLPRMHPVTERKAL